MDAEDIRRKRMRLFAPSQSHQSLTPLPSQQAQQQQPGMASDSGVIHPSFSGDDTIDLTASDSEGTLRADDTDMDDEQFAKKLQALFDQENTSDVPPVAPPLSANDLHAIATAGGAADYKDYVDFSGDLHYALQLQQQYNAEDDSDNSDGYPMPQPATDAEDDGDSTPTGPTMPRVSKIAIPDAVDQSGHAQAVRNYATAILGAACVGCGARRFKDMSSLEATFRARLTPAVGNASSVPDGRPLDANQSPFLIDLRFPCEQCHALICLACGCPDPHVKDFGKCENMLIRGHCDMDRLLLIFVMLCCYDYAVAEIRATKRRDTARPAHRHSGRFRGRSTYPGRGRGSKQLPKGIGYGSDSRWEDYDEDDDTHGHPNEEELSLEPHFLPKAKHGSKSKIQQRERSPIRHDPEDSITSHVMEALSLLLPSIERTHAPSAFDCDPPSILVSMLSRSSVIDKTAELLRNDSLEDITPRSSLYTSVLGLVRSLSSHHITNATIVHEKRGINHSGHNLFRVASVEPTRHQHESQEYGIPLVECMRNLGSQCSLLLRSANANAANFVGDESQQLLLICRNITDLSEFLQANGIKESGAETADDATAQTPVNSTDWQVDLRLAELPDDILLANSVYGEQAKELSDPAPGRMRRIFKEIAGLKTDLPPGIFVRYGSSRPDMMKVLIIGPEGTPYENGLFEFDLLCPEQYPNEPPKMSFRTTGGGIAHFNPNLYQDGKVCLSLLGTWSGEKWKPGKSTLLQVFVSLQAMVFNDEPWANEPGREGDRDTVQSRNYNRQCYPLTIKHAMVEWLEGKASILQRRVSHRAYSGLPSIDPLHSLVFAHPKTTYNFHGPGRTIGEADLKTEPESLPCDLWADVVQQHFKVNEKAITATMERWINDKMEEHSRRRKKYPTKGKGKQKAVSSVFKGTGWTGRALGGDDLPRPVDSSDQWHEADTLVAKLKGALAQLQNNCRKGYPISPIHDNDDDIDVEEQDYDEDL